MLVVETIARIRRAYFVQGKTIKAICRELRVSRKVVRKVIRSGTTAFEYEHRVQPQPKLGAWRGELEKLLVANASRPTRERLTLMRLFEELRGLGYAGGYDAVRRYAVRWRREQSASTATAFVPLSFAPGEAYQFDWSHEVVVINGVTTIAKVAHMWLCHSRLWAARSAVHQIHSRVPAAGGRTMNVRARLGWVKLYEQIGDAGVVCRRCGISRPTLRKWWRRYQADGEAGLHDRSRRPHRSPQRRVFEREEQLILELRRDRQLGIKRLRNELIRLHDLRLAIHTIHKVLVRHGENRLKRRRLQRKKGRKRYSRPVPGDRVQMDVCKIAGGLYQFTAIDDCSRYQVVALHPRKTARCTLAFLDQVIEEMPFAIQRIQTDRGQEFFAYDVQDALRERCIKFRPTKPRSPHLNGKVERVQRTALEEFWPTVDLGDPELPDRLAEWQHFYNWQRPHDSLAGKAPIDRVCERLSRTPFWDDVDEAYDPAKEHIRINDYAWDNRIHPAKR